MTLKFCKDCRYCPDPPKTFWQKLTTAEPKCQHPMAALGPAFDAVTGVELEPRSQARCQIMRATDKGSGCGYLAKYFEPRRTIE